MMHPEIRHRILPNINLHPLKPLNS